MRTRNVTLFLGLAFLFGAVSCGGNPSNSVSVPGATNPPPPSATADVRAAYLVSQMTLAEKIQLLHGGAALDWTNQMLPRGAAGWIPGILRLNIPDLYFADGSVGVGNKVGPATALPSSIASAASWDLDEAAKYGHVIGVESRAYGINVNLGGNVNLIGREPRDGRTFETKGEDPLLAGKITAAHLEGIQSAYVMAGIKHYGFNDQETGRTTANVIIDERSGRESDLLAFEIGLKDSNVQSVMCAYNLVNGIYGCENSYLLNTVLKGDWGFAGFVMSDWDATHSTVAAAQSGLDQEQPENIYFGSNLLQAVQSGQVSPARLDDMVQRVLRAVFAAGIFDHPATVQPIDAAADGAIAQEIEEQGAVLLKNSGSLPLNKTAIRSIAIIGSHADIAVLSGGGSAQVNPVGGAALNEGNPCPPCWARVIWDPSSPLNAIQAKVPSATVRFNDGSNPGAAAALAASSDVAVVFVSQWESEGMDVPSLNFTDVIHPVPTDQDGLVNAVSAANPNTIVVLENGGAQVMPWLRNVNAVLEAWYPGQKGGDAIANILFGDVNPSGKLPMTFPASIGDLPRPVIALPPNGTTPFNVDYTIDGADVGYKWYDRKGLTPLFPFGFGLSYTNFSITNPLVAANVSAAPLGFQVSFNLQNTGGRTGSQVVQAYLQLPSSTGESRRLVGWKKVSVTAGQLQTVTISVADSDSSHPLDYWDVSSHGWRAASGVYTVFLGDSSRNLLQVGTFQIP